FLIDDCLKITTCSRCKDCCFLKYHDQKCTPSCGVTEPITIASSPFFLKAFKASSTSVSATTTPIPIPMLKIPYISSGVTLPISCKKEKIGGISQLPFFISTPSPAGNILGKFS